MAIPASSRPGRNLLLSSNLKVRLLASIGALAVVGSATLLIFAAGADHRVSGQELVLELSIGLLYLAAGLLAWKRQRASAIGRLMALAGLLWLAAHGSLRMRASLLFTIGLVAISLSLAFLVHMAVSFPSGRLYSTFDRWVVGGAYVVFFSEIALFEAGPGTRRRNLLQAPVDEGLRAVLQDVLSAATLLVIAGFIAALVGHWRAGTTAARRVLGPVLVAAVVLAVALAGGPLARLGVPFWPTSVWGLAQYLAAAAVPVSFLAGLLRSRLARAGVGELVVELEEASPPDQLRAGLARALGDPTVELVYWNPDTKRYVDETGRAVAMPSEDAGRAVTAIERAGVRVGALVHDPAVLQEGALLEGACAAAGLALENDRLHADVLARLEEVRASRARIVEAGDVERRRLERNLHDGAQQRFVTVSLALTMARNRLGPGSDPAVDQMLREAAGELDLGLRELRELAAGIHPAILTEQGLAAALESLAERSPVPVEVHAAVPARLPPAVEAGAYYLVSEALANVAKHAGANLVTVQVEHGGGWLRVEVVDDGVGGAQLRPGSGLEGLADRVAALDGQFGIDSEPGRGTRLSAHIPCG